MSRFLALLDYFVPASLSTADPLRREQARLAVGIALAISVWGPVFSVVLWALGSYSLAGASAAGSAVWLAILYVFHRTGSYFVFGNVVAGALFAELMLIGLVTGGMDGNVLFWSLLVPMIATGIAGMRSGLFWSAVVLSGMVGFTDRKFDFS